MNSVPVAGIDVGKEFSELAILTPTNEVYARLHIKHKTQLDFDNAVQLLNKAEDVSIQEHPKNKSYEYYEDKIYQTNHIFFW